MTRQARTALINIGTQRQGTPVANNTPADVIEELQNLGYIGRNHGLTRKGSIKRQFITEDQLNELFG